LVCGNFILRQQAFGLTIERWGSPIKRARLRSRIAAQWSPGLREKGQKEADAVGRVADIQTPSMVVLPTQFLHLKVTGGRG